MKIAIMSDNLSKKTGNNSGFTLIEILVAVIILGLSYVVVLQSFSVSMTNIHRLDTSRKSMWQTAAEFEKKLEPVSEEDDESELLEQGALFMEGRKYNLMMIKDPDSKLTTLKLQKNQ
jgi:prepilin-type N-terminal cleavage/methylation domain-containing protein